MPYSILWISIWSYNTVYMKYVQNSWMPAFLVCFIYSRVLVAFLNFRIVKSVIFLGQKKKRPALNVFVISWTTPCQNSMSNLKLRAASPISGCGRGLAGPARRGCKSSNLKMIILLKNSGTSRRPFLTRQGGNEVELHTTIVEKVVICAKIEWK